MKIKRVSLRIFLPEQSCVLACIFLLLSALSPDAYALPRVTTVLASATVSSGRTFNIVINISWQGDADEYIIVPPEPVFPEGIRLVSSSFSSSVSSDNRLLDYQYNLKAEKPGAFTLQPVQIHYWEKGSDKESSLTTEEISLRAVRFAFFELYRTWLISAAGLLLCGAAILAVRLYYKKRKLKKAQVPIALDDKNIFEQLQRCRQCKISGDYKGFYQSVLAAGKSFFGEDKTFIDNAEDMLEKVSFGGYWPSAEEVDRIFRQLEKRIGDITSQNKQQDLEYVKYCK
ncbi:MAG: BatD family protein [Pseudomonadota bacterium]